MKNFKKLLEKNDVFSIKYLNENDPKYSDDCKKIIMHVRSGGILSAEEILKNCGQSAALLYISLCNSSMQDEFGFKILKHSAKVNVSKIELNEKNCDLSVIINDIDSIDKLNRWLQYLSDKDWFKESLRNLLSKEVYKKLGIKKL